jgi:hypothetical protein
LRVSTTPATFFIASHTDAVICAGPLKPFVWVELSFNFPFHFATTATSIATLMAASLAFFTSANWDTREGALASAATDGTGSGSLAMTFRTQKPVWHLT